MTKAVVKLVSLVMVLMLIFSTALNLSAVDLSESSTVTTYKISDELKSHISTLNDDDVVKVCLWFEDIDYDEVEEMVEKSIGISADDMSILSNAIYKAYCNNKDVSLNSLKLGEISADQVDWMNQTKEIRDDVNDKVDQYISAKRTTFAQKQLKKTITILSDLNIKTDNCTFISKYSPMCIVEIEVSKIPEISSCEQVVSIELIQEEITEDLTESIIESSENSTRAYTESQLMNYHKLAAGAYGLSPTYSGEGIKIGMFEGRKPDITSPVLSNSNIVLINSSQSTVTTDTYHATTVAAIMVGSNGLVPNAQLYAISAHQRATDEQKLMALETLIDNGVNIINRSYGKMVSVTVSYDSVEKWYDYISKNHNILIVQAAGNDVDGSNDNNIVRPALAYNLLTVGNFNDKCDSSNSNDFIHPSSCYNSTYDNCKPELIAPGTDFPYYGQTVTTDFGTSYSAPMVTSIAAYLMQANPTLKTNPVAVKAILVASCNRKVLDSDEETQYEELGGLTEKQGAGAVNASIALTIVLNSKYSTGTVSDLDANSYFEVPAIEMSNSSRRSFALAWETNIEESENPFTDSSLSYFNCDFDLKIRTTTNQEIIEDSTNTNSSVEVVNIPSTVNTFFMRAINKNAIADDQTVRYAFAWCGQ